MALPSRVFPFLLGLLLAGSATRAAAAAPTLTTISTLTGGNEDTATSIPFVTLRNASNAGDADNDPIQFRFKSAVNGTLREGGTPVAVNGTLGNGETWSWTPPADANGLIDAFVVRAFAGGEESGTDVVVKINVSAVNDAPSFTKGANVTVAEDPGAYSQAGWATDVVAGPSDESGQTLSFTVTAGTPGLFSVAPSVSPNGTLTFTPAANANGTSSVSIKLVDSGSGSNESAVQTFNITVTPVADAPTLGGAIAGTAANPLSDVAVSSSETAETYKIFETITIDDVDHNRPNADRQTVTVTVSNDAALYGTFTLPDFTSTPGTGVTVYTKSNLTPDEAETYVRKGTFQPLTNHVPVATYTFGVTVDVKDSTNPTPLAAAAALNGPVHVQSVNDLPVVTPSTTVASIPDNAEALPFRLLVSDPDVNEAFSVTIQETGLASNWRGDLMPPANPMTGNAEGVANAMQAVRYIPKNQASTQTATFAVAVSDVHPTGTPGAAVTSNVSLTILAVNSAPEIAGITTNLIRTTDDVPVHPFSTVTITDADPGQILSVGISLDDAAKGSFTYVLNGAIVPLSGPLSGTADVLTTWLRSVVFKPAANRIPVNDSETVTITLSVNDTIVTRTNSQTKVEVTSVNGAPELTWTGGAGSDFPDPSNPALINPVPSAKPFAAVGISDEGEVTVTVTLDDAAKGELTNLGGFLETAPGSRSYRLSGAPATLQTLIRAMVFVPSSTYSFPPNQPGRTDFTISASDSALNVTSRVLPIVLRSAARTFMVTSALDNPTLPGTLRHAISVAASNDVITFALPSYPAVIRLSAANGPLVINKHLNFDGPGQDKLTITGDSNSNGIADPADVQLFRVFAGARIKGLRLARGFAGTGGAVYVGRLQPDAAPGSLVLEDCAITNCLASQWGGAVDVDAGILRVERCVFEGNSLNASSGLGGGAISLYTKEACTILNSTFAGNSQSAPTGFGGGAIYVENDTPDRLFQTAVTHCTFSGNIDAANKGSSIHGNVSNTRVLVSNTIFADFSARNLQVAGGGEIVSNGGNLSNDNTTTTLIQGGVPQQATLLNKASDKRNTDPKLAAIAAVEGQTRGFRLLPDSPAIAAGLPGLAPVDQRGVIRNATVDSGALDAQALGKLIIHEIFAPQTTSDPHFIEFFNPRDQAAVDLNGYEIWIDGEKRHVFSAPLVIHAGYGFILAESTTLTPVAAHPNTPVILPSVGGQLDLRSRGRIELCAPSASGMKVMEAVSYVAVFANPSAPAASFDYDTGSITLAPQFQGAAFVPHSLVQSPPNGGVLMSATGELTSPGADTDGTPFGEDNAYPIAVNDRMEITEDEIATLNVLANDLDADGSDEVVVVDLNPTLSATPPGSSKPTILSPGGASVAITPASAPLRGTAISFDPRSAFKSLPEGARVTDAFAYTVLDFGGGDVSAYADGGSGKTLVSATSNRLADGVTVVIRDAGAYSGSHVISGVTADSFLIPVAFVGDPGPLARGHWQAADSRTPTARDEALVEVSILGRNDPPTPAADIVATNEDTILRIFGDPALAGTGTALDTDGLYPAPRQFAAVGMLANDSDPDTDDNPFTKLHVIGVCQASPITGFSGTPGSSPITVSAPAHGLESGATVLISGYGGHPSYNGYQVITVVDGDTFTIPVAYVDNHAEKGLWASLNDANRLSTTSQHGAEIALEIRANRTQTNVVYNPRSSAHLNGLAVGESDTDRFYYAVEDTHGAVSLAQVAVSVAGVNDTPLPGDNPPSLADLGPQVTGGLPLPQFLKDLDVLYLLPSSGGAGTVNVAIRPPAGGPNDVVVIAGLDQTDEDSALALSSSGLLSNDTDVDRTNLLRVELGAGQNLSREGAAIRLSPDGSVLTYDPTLAPKLQALAFKERLIDTFNITVFDGTARVVSLVAVIVEGRNDQPVASNVNLTTAEKTLLEVKPPGLLLSGLEIDQDGSLPDNRKFLLPVVDSATTVAGAKVNVSLEQRDGTIDSFGPVAGSPALTSVLSIAHGLQSGEDVVLPDSGVLAGRYTVTRIDADHFSIPVAYDASFASLNGGPWKVLASTFAYDPRGSVFPGATGGPAFTLQGLAEGQEYFDTFTYTLLDGSFLFANDDIFRIEADRTDIELKVLANDTNLDGIASGRRIVEAGPPSAGGSVGLNGDQSLIYTPETGFVGDEVFTYTIEDSLGNRDTALVTARVTVDRLNGNLRANPDHFTVAAGQAPLLQVLANDNIIPATGDPLTLASISSAPDEGGQAVIEGSQIRYTPSTSASIFPYTEIFQYTMSGGGTTTASTMVTVVVVDRSNTLNVRADSFGVPAGSNGVTLNVLENDNILPGNGEDLEIVSTTAPPHGAVEIVGGVALSYTPAAGFLGNDTFSYSVTDGTGGTGIAQVTVRVGYLTTNSDIFSVRFDDPSKTDDNGVTELDVLANDNVIQGGSGVLTITGVTPPATALGTMAITPGGTSLRFDPATSATGQQDFTYTVADGGGRTATGTLTVVVVASGIRASSDYFTVQTDSSETELVVLSNDIRNSDVPGELAVASIGTGPNAPDQGGTVVISEDFKRIIYTPAPGFQGVESFTYTVTDGESSDTARVSVRSTAGELVAAEDAFLVFRGSSANRLAVLFNDRILPDAGQVLTITAVGMDPGNPSNPTHRGSLEIIEGNTALSYTPSPDNTSYPYVETFTYDISVGGTSRAEGLIRIEVLDRVGARNLETNHDVFTLRSDSTGTLLPVMANDSVLPATTTGWAITEVTPPTANVCSPFLMGDFLQPAALASRLAAQASPLDQYLWSRFLPASRTLLANAATPEQQLRITLVAEFNDIASGVAIYDPTRFSGITLREQTQALIDEGVTGEQRIVLNRLLLEDAFTAEVRQSAGGGAVQLSESGIVYAPQPGFVGTERFTYRVSDGLGGTGFAEVIVRVGDVSVSDDFYVAVAGAGPVSLDVTANDGIYRTSFPATPLPSQADFTLAPGKPITVAPVAAGSAVVDGSVVKFTPAAAFSGHATLTYWVQDDSGCLFSGKATVDIREPGDDRDTAVATIKVTGVNDAPQLINAVASAVNDKSSVHPFANATVIEFDEQRLQLVRVRVSYPDGHGVLSGDFTRISPDVIEFYGTAAEVTAAMRALLFTPYPNRITVGQTEDTRFTVSLDDDIVAVPVVVDSAVSVVTPVNDAPVITGTVANQKLYQFSTLRPFAGVDITDIDDLGLQTLSVAVQIDNAAKGNLSNLNGFVQQPAGSGIYRVSGTPATVAAALRGLVFEPTPGGRVTPEAPELASFTVTIEDGFAPVVTDTHTSVLVLHGEVDRVLALGAAGADVSQASAAFGSSVAIYGDTMAVGSPLRDTSASDAGRVYIYERNAGFGAPWGQVTEITGADTVAGDHFGQSIAIDGDVMVVGAPDARSGGSNRTGAIYVFNRSTTDPHAWVQVVKLAPPLVNGSGGDLFGTSVAIQGNTILAGAPLANLAGAARSGRVFAFRRGATPAAWTHVQTLVAADNRASGLAGDSEFFGFSVAIEGNTTIIGAPGANRGGGVSQWNYGAAYVFTRTGTETSWSEVKRFDEFEKPTGATYSGFGYSVDISGDRIAVGVHSVGSPVGTFRAGGARLYERNAGGANQWGEIIQIAPADGIPSPYYATSITLAGDLLLVGSPGPSQGSTENRGYVELYRHQTSGPLAWALIDRFAPGSTISADRFGESLAIDRFTAVAGAAGDSVNLGSAAGAGSARVYQFQYDQGPRLTRTVADQIAVEGAPFNFAVDASTFDDPVYPGNLVWGAELEDGSPLPPAAWLSFNPETKAFSGTPTPSNNGDYRLILHATNPLGTRIISNVFRIGLSSAAGSLEAAYDDWLTGQFTAGQLGNSALEATLWGMAADPDNDGQENILEMLFGSDPEIALPVQTIFQRTTSTQVSFRFPISADFPADSVKVEWSSNMSSWSRTGVVMTLTDLPGNTDQMTAVVTLPAPQVKVFVRVIVDP